MTSAVLQAWAVPDDLTPSEWADENRWIDPKTSDVGGPWRTDLVPWTREPMDAFADPVVRQITLLKCVQSAGTEAGINQLGYAISRAPGPALFVMADQAMARKTSNQRVRPMIEGSPDLAKYLPADRDDFSKGEYNLRNMNVDYGWAGSPSSLASTPKKYVWFDEPDKYPPFSGKESDPIRLGSERVSTFMDSKIVVICTPTTEDGYVSVQYEKSSKEQYHVPCPLCGKYQVLKFGNLKVRGDCSDPEEIVDRRLAYYVCEHCNGEIEESHKRDMVSKGRWLSDEQKVNKNGVVTGKRKRNRHRGFRWNFMILPWLNKTWSHGYAENIESKGDPSAEMNFANAWLAEAYVEKDEEILEDTLTARVQGYSASLLPEKVDFLTAGVDWHKYHINVVIRGWGVGGESFGVAFEDLDNQEQLEELLFHREWKKVGGDLLTPVVVCVDSGYLPETVYRFSREWDMPGQRVRATKGKSHETNEIYTKSTLDRDPKTGKQIKGGQDLWMINTKFFKNMLSSLIHKDKEGVTVWHLPSDDILVDYFKQMVNEHKIAKVNKQTRKKTWLWVPVTDSAPVHFWDCEVLATVAAYMKNMNLFKPVKRTGKSSGRRVKRRLPVRRAGSTSSAGYMG